MCLITLYSEKVGNDNKLFADIAQFEVDLEGRMLRVYSLLGELKEYADIKRIVWREKDDSMVMEVNGGSGDKLQADI